MGTGLKRHEEGRGGEDIKVVFRCNLREEMHEKKKERKKRKREQNKRRDNEYNDIVLKLMVHGDVNNALMYLTIDVHPRGHCSCPAILPGKFCCKRLLFCPYTIHLFLKVLSMQFITFYPEDGQKA